MNTVKYQHEKGGFYIEKKRLALLVVKVLSEKKCSVSPEITVMEALESSFLIFLAHVIPVIPFPMITIFMDDFIKLESTDELDPNH
ncbi:MAG: hypothetical protein ACOYKR_08405 [Sphingobacterium thalpophilum]